MTIDKKQKETNQIKVSDILEKSDKLSQEWLSKGLQRYPNKETK